MSSMRDYLRESTSYFGLMKRVKQVPKTIEPESYSFGEDKDCYYLYYEPKTPKSDKVIVWTHGGGWNAGDPKFFDYVGQSVASSGYRFVSLGYRLSQKHKYPCQIEDVCKGYMHAVGMLKSRGIDTSKIIVSGPSAGAHLTSILCYSKKDQEKYGVDTAGIIGYVGFGGPYSFREDQSFTLRLLLNRLFEKGYDRKSAEPASLMEGNGIPMLLIQSEHDGLIEFGCAQDLAKRAEEVGNPCEIYRVTDREDTHSWYTAGLFTQSRNENKALDRFFAWIDER